ncbi:hypothetical protein ES703_58437 [subsurface metagenome]
MWSFTIQHASRIMFPSYYATEPTLFVGVAAVEEFDGAGTCDGFGEGGDVYRVADTVPPSGCIDLNVQGYLAGCLGLSHANICSLDIENDALVAGAWDSYQLQSPTRVYYSADGGWTWSPSLKDPTGFDRCYVLFGGSIVAATNGCDCAFSLDCGANPGQFFNQISLIAMSIDEVLDLTHSPGYAVDSSTMFALTSGASVARCCRDSFSITATTAPAALTVVVNAGTVTVEVLTETGLTAITITEAPVGTYTVTLPDANDTILVTATSDATNVTVTVTAGVLLYIEVSDCDGDMTFAGDANPQDMPDGVSPEIRSLLRWDGTYWERVHSSHLYNALLQTWLTSTTGSPFYDWVEVSPDFNTTTTLYMANTGFHMTRSIDAGCSWAPLIYPCLARPDISAWIVADEETVLAAGAGAFAGNVYRTLNHGAQPWSTFAVAAFPAGVASDGVDFDLSLPRNADSDLLLGDVDGRVYFSGDLGATWAEIQDAITGDFDVATHNTYVVFDPGYGVTDDPGVSMIYAAAGTVVGRCALDLAGALPFKQDWVYISATTAATTCDPFVLCVASGIDAAGDTALYVSDAGTVAVLGGDELTGTMAVSYNGGAASCDLDLLGSNYTLLTESLPCGEPMSIVAYDLECTATGILGTVVAQGLVSGDMIRIDVVELVGAPCAACAPVGSAYAVISSDLTLTCATSTYCPTGVWRTLNPMDWMTTVHPLDKVEWEFLDASTAGAVSLLHPEAFLAAGGSFATPVFPDDLWVTLTAASNVLWALEDDGVPQDTATNSIWIWDDPLARPVIQIQPADGTLLPTTTVATIEWTALDNATLYEYFIFSYCATCPDNMVLLYNLTTADTCIVLTGLTAGTKYFWKVRVACNSPQVSKWSALHSFDTALDTVPYLCAPWCGQDDVILTTNFAWDPVAGALSYELQIVAASADGTADWTGAATYTSAENAYASIPGLEYSTVYYWRVRSVNVSIYSAWAVCLFTTADVPAEPVDPLPPVEVITEEITPVWIWVIIAIGGALTIAVVILIVTTRRVP